MKKKTKINPLQKLLNNLKEKDKDGLFAQASANYLEKQNAEINARLKEIQKANLAKHSRLFNTNFRRNFKSIVKDDIYKHNVGLSSYKMKDLSPKFEKEYRKANLLSIERIKQHNADFFIKLKLRFVNWISGNKEALGDTLKMPNDKKTLFLLRDQTAKISANLDNIIATEYEAIAFQWKTRNDKRVAGKPGGLYPNADKNSPIHGDHWSRRNKWYYYKNSWAVKKGLLNLSKFAGAAEDIPDGLPATPIGCRCYAANYYELNDLPKELVKVKK